MPAVDATACLAGPRAARAWAVQRRRDGGRPAVSAAWCGGCCGRWPPTSAASSPPATASGSCRRGPAPPRPTPSAAGGRATVEGVIERVEPRHGLLTRASRGREHVLVANVDQVVFVVSLVEPDLKPHLIDRYLASAEQGGIRPILCLNKADLVDPVDYQPLVGLYSQLGVPTFLTSAATGPGIDRLRQRLHGPGDGVFRPERRGQVVAAERDPAGTGAAGARGERRQPEGPAHDDDGRADPAGLRRLGGGHAGRAAVRAVGRDPGGSGGLFRGISAVRGAVRLPRLHAHARGPLRRQARRCPPLDHAVAVYRAIWGCSRGRRPD